VLFALAATSAAAARGHGQVKIIAPRTVHEPRSASFAVRISAPAKRIAFFVDGRRLWVTRPHRWKFRRHGRLSTARMAPGRHRLGIRARLSNGRVASARRVLFVARGKSTHEHGHKNKEPSSTTESEANSSTPSGLLFDGSHISDFEDLQAAPGAVTEVPDPASDGGTAIKMTVNDSDASYFNDETPRAQLLSPRIIEPGDEFWWHSSFFLPSDFPSYVSSWINLMEGPYGPPYGGAPAWRICMDHGSDLRWERNRTYEWDIPWSMPLVRNRWVDVLMHERFGTDGWVEMWIDGQQVTFFDPNTEGKVYNPNHLSPTQRLYMQTMDASNDGGPNFAVIQNYRGAGWIESVTVYHGPMKLGTTRASVGG
jgi:hypothetical protein